LEFIDNAVDPDTGTVLMKAVFENAGHVLWPGEFVNVVVERGREEGVVLVPASAVQPGQGGAQLVFVVGADGVARVRQVKTGRSENGLVVIAEGVSEGELVVTDGQLRLTDGARVEVKKLEELGK
jgi:multidrug efflux system membrane fusion protein